MSWNQVVLLMLCSFSNSLALAEDVPPLAAAQPRPVANAATVYWQAFAALPKLAPEEQKQFDAARAAMAEPVGADMAPLIERFAPALKLMRRASEAKACDWELDYSEGPMLLLPHLAKLRELGFAAMLRAKLRFAENDTAGATSDLLATLKMARHAAISPLLISVLVGASMEAPATNLLASHLPQLDRPTLGRLTTELAALPATPSVADCLNVEGTYFINWLEILAQADRAQGQKPIVGGGLVKTLKALGIFTDLDEEAGKQLAESLDTPEKLQAALTRLRKVYAEMARIAAWDSYPARYEQMKQFDDDLAKSNANLRTLEPDRLLSLLAVPAISRVIDREAKRDVRSAMLGVALRVQLDGKASLKTAPHLGDGVLDYKATASGFELRYRIAPTSDWEVLTVGHPKQ